MSFFHSQTRYAAIVQGASRGIGLALVQALLADPNCKRLYASCRQPDQVKQLQALAAEHAKLKLLALDLLDEGSIQQAAAVIAGEGGSLQLLLNVSGLLHGRLASGAAIRPEKQLAELDAESALESYRVNALGPSLVLKHFLPLLPRREPAIMASLSARVGSISDNRLGGWYSYRAAKAAQNMLTRTTAIELRRSHPGAICVGLHPGTTDTELSQPFQRNVPPGKLFTPAFVAERLLAVLSGLESADSGKVFAWDGSVVPE